MRIIVHVAPSRHGGKQGRAQVSEAVRKAMRGQRLARRVWRPTVTLYGDWFQKDGAPRSRNTDSICIPLFDAIATHGGLKDDKWLTGHGFTVNKPVQAAHETVIVDLE